MPPAPLIICCTSATSPPIANFSPVDKKPPLANLVPPPAWFIADSIGLNIAVERLFIIASPPSASCTLPPTANLTPPLACEAPLNIPPLVRPPCSNLPPPTLPIRLLINGVIKLFIPTAIPTLARKGSVLSLNKLAIASSNISFTFWLKRDDIASCAVSACKIVFCIFCNSCSSFFSRVFCSALDCFLFAIATACSAAFSCAFKSINFADAWKWTEDISFTKFNSLLYVSSFKSNIACCNSASVEISPSIYCCLNSVVPSAIICSNSFILLKTVAGLGRKSFNGSELAGLPPVGVMVLVVVSSCLSNSIPNSFISVNFCSLSKLVSFANSSISCSALFSCRLFKSILFTSWSPPPILLSRLFCSILSPKSSACSWRLRPSFKDKLCLSDSIAISASKSFALSLFLFIPTASSWDASSIFSSSCCKSILLTSISLTPRNDFFNSSLLTFSASMFFK